MNLRDFKKDVEYCVGEFIDDCCIFIQLNPNKDTEKIGSIIAEGVDLYNDMKDKANVKVDRQKRTYYAELRKEMFSKVDSLYEQLSVIVSEK